MICLILTFEKADDQISDLPMLGGGGLRASRLDYFRIVDGSRRYDLLSHERYVTAVHVCVMEKISDSLFSSNSGGMAIVVYLLT